MTVFPEDIAKAFGTIKKSGPHWDLKHPQRRYVTAANCAETAIEHMRHAAAEALAGEPLLLSDIDGALDALMRAAKLLLQERPNLPWCLKSETDTPDILGIRRVTAKEAKKLGWRYP